jgi:2-hydroxy-3-oxopropionate reductase
MAKKVGVIGLGVMGLPIAKNLITAGFDVEVWNRSQPAIEKAASFGAHSVTSLSDFTAPIILTVLPDIYEVREVLKNGLQAALAPNSILVIMGTVSPQAIIKLEKELKEAQIRLVDSPMSGGDVGAINATLSLMVGCDATTFEELAEVFAAIGKTIRLVGPVGAGQLTKACNQAIVAINLTALGEAITLARKSGLDTKSVFDILAGGLANSQVLNIKREKIESGDFTPGGFAKFQLKDLNYATQTASEHGVDMPVTQLVRDLFKDLVDHGDGELDHSAIIREIERRAR